jgi:uncharacterized protein
VSQYIRFLLIFTALWLPSFSLEARVEIPSLSGPVMDQANLIKPQTQEFLDRMLRSSVDVIQLQIWTIPSLGAEPIESLALRAVERWKLGDEKSDNGVLLLVARDDRQIRIEVGQGLEGSIPDILASRIIRELMTPAFREGDFSGGIKQAAERIVALAYEDPSAAEWANSKGSEMPPVLMLVLFLLFLLASLGAVFRRALHGVPARRSGRGVWYTPGAFGGNRPGGFGGGGGWSGGGGGFSGGGASGGW